MTGIGLAHPRRVKLMYASEPTAVRTLSPRLDDAGLATSVDPTVASLLRSLVATTEGGVYLLSGASLAGYAGWVLDGMDISSRLIVNLPTEYVSSVVQPCFDMDLRITGHVQGIDEFIGDVSRHRFALVGIDCGLLDDTRQTFGAMLKLINMGGWLLLSDPEQQHIDALMQDHEGQWCVTPGLAEGRLCLACRRAVALGNRRGGRRGRLQARQSAS